MGTSDRMPVAIRRLQHCDNIPALARYSEGGVRCARNRGAKCLARITARSRVARCEPLSAGSLVGRVIRSIHRGWPPTSTPWPARTETGTRLHDRRQNANSIQPGTIHPEELAKTAAVTAQRPSVQAAITVHEYTTAVLPCKFESNRAVSAGSNTI
jgi:hypothetical protein